MRQGCLLLPFLFNIVGEALSVLITKAARIGILKGVSVESEGLEVTHLQFADDFIDVRGGFRTTNLPTWAEWISCDIEALPTSYLGLPLGQSRNSLAIWQPIIDKVQSRLDGWKGKLLSFARRLTLAKSVLSNLPIFYTSLFKLPATIASKLNKMVASFIWGANDKSAIHWGLWRYGVGIKQLVEACDRWRRIFDWKKECWSSFMNTLNKASMSSGKSDSVRWIGTSSGYYQPKTFYEKIFPERNIEDHIGDLVWANLVPVKNEFFVWRAVHNHIPVRDELLKQGVCNLDLGHCIFCKDHLETSSHLFCQCVVVWKVWHSWCCCWNINLVPCECVIQRKAKSATSSWFMVCSSAGELKFNVDATVKDCFGFARIGGLLRDHNGITLIRFSRPVGLADLAGAELLAILEASVNWIVNPTSISSVHVDVVRKIVEYCNENKWMVKFVYGERNMEAHWLAQEGKVGCLNLSPRLLHLDPTGSRLLAQCLSPRCYKWILLVTTFWLSVHVSKRALLKGYSALP
ncbi:hypothetical protein F3Y22_tig00110904pilonHSYRG00039 [Hibiscus syriacus]|uniref:Reverse transcriptase zinc-binding domain-containing protein n=1 Tax=Hibiscus syriacus TaxID=106335 RepID=A0A6A2ZFB6_HIBSY|nr:hypothetical protein F3Y22_tig00110904pilonHSYRG00039 [Hibiscus syriacus]